MPRTSKGTHVTARLTRRPIFGGSTLMEEM